VIAEGLIAESSLGEREATHVLALANAATMDAAIGCWDAKYHFVFFRPWQADPTITTPIGRPNHPSFPSGHSCLSAAAASVLESFFPERAATLDALVAEAGESRILGGLHYRFDVTAGQTLGRAVAANAIAYDGARGLLAAVR
jgi:membrane-associated phospholipid phosphatase